MDALMPEQALRTARFIWGGILMGQLTFIAVVAFIVSGGAGQGDGLPFPAFGVAAAAGAGAIVLAHFVRMQVFKRHWEGDRITPQGYVTGTMIHLAILEGASMLALVFAMLEGQLFPLLLPVFALLAVQVMSFPTGRPMQPAV